MGGTGLLNFSNGFGLLDGDVALVGAPGCMCAPAVSRPVQ